MLILTRKNGESINIGDDIKITILGITGQQVRVGIDAPKEVPVHREEIYQRNKAVKIGALTAPIGHLAKAWSKQKQNEFVSALCEVAQVEGR